MRARISSTRLAASSGGSDTPVPPCVRAQSLNDPVSRLRMPAPHPQKGGARRERRRGGKGVRRGAAGREWATGVSRTGSGQMLEQPDLVVIGMGVGGEEVAGRAAESGMRVLGIERKLVGGECPYWGCIPSKMMVRAAK